MSSDAPSSAHYISPEQLCIGLHVHLDLSWSEHPFAFSSFKIKTADQIATIRGLGLSRIRFSPDKSDGPPAPAGPKPHDAAPPPSTPGAPDPALLEMKRQRVEKLNALRAKAAACEKELLSAAKTIKSINQNIFSKPQEVQQAATDLIKGMAASMMVDADVSIQLMADKIGNEDTYYHSLNVSLLSMMLAKELKAPAPVIQLVGMGALLHDVGELEIPERVVRKQEPRNKAEQSLYQMHCDYGINVVSKMNLPNEVLQVISQHHERVDGSGYPRGLKAAQMSLLSRIVSLVNAYDEMCNPPNPAHAMTPHEAVSTMYAQQRAQFDQLALTTFVRCIGVYPPGTVVQLSNGALAIVTSVNTSKPLRPVVLVHDPAIPKEEAMLVDLETEPDVSITKTLRPQQISDEARAYLAVRTRMAYYFDSETGKVG